jgi:alkanesulfonate monooxygenase SsuD/methylene tetrahydromethanopterin reductase-like flavin-dependent oxidoreductase (luciferase family)
MAFLSMRQDFRAPAFAPESAQEIYATALEQFAWADKIGFDSLVLSEHHGVDDGWLPAPLTMAAAVLARTERARLMISAPILP